MTDASIAPDLVGLHPDDAARRWLKLGVVLTIEDAKWVSSYWGHGRLWRVTEQLPKAGERMSSSVIVVRPMQADGLRA